MGFFEAVFFRVYVIAIAEPMVGIIPAVAASAALYALYEVGYGMTGGEMVLVPTVPAQRAPGPTRGDGATRIRGVTAYPAPDRRIGG